MLTFRIGDVFANDAGDITCELQNAAGRASCSCQLSVQGGITQIITFICCSVMLINEGNIWNNISKCADLNM